MSVEPFRGSPGITQGGSCMVRGCEEKAANNYLCQRHHTAWNKGESLAQDAKPYIPGVCAAKGCRCPCPAKTAEDKHGPQGFCLTQSQWSQRYCSHYEKEKMAKPCPHAGSGSSSGVRSASPPTAASASSPCASCSTLKQQVSKLESEKKTLEAGKKAAEQKLESEKKTFLAEKKTLQEKANCVEKELAGVTKEKEAEVAQMKGLLQQQASRLQELSQKSASNASSGGGGEKEKMLEERVAMLKAQLEKSEEREATLRTQNAKLLEKVLG